MVRGQLSHDTGRVAGDHGIRVLLLVKTEYVDTLAQFSTGRPGPTLQPSLQLVLGHHEHERESGRKPRQVDPDTAEQLEATDRTSRGDKVVCQPPSVEQFQRSSMHRKGPRQVGLGAPSFED